MINRTSCFFGTRDDGKYAATYEITNRCNLFCKHCMNDSSKEACIGLPLQKVFSLLEELRALDVENLYITGGEPLLYPDIDEVLRYSRKIGFETSLATNATEIISHIDTVRENVSAVSVSIDGIGATFDRFRQCEGLFKRVKNALVYLKENKVSIVISTVLWKGNLNQIEKIVLFAIEHGAKQINFSYLVATGRAIDNTIHLSGAEYETAFEEVMRCKALYDKPNFTVVFRRSTSIDSKCKDCEGGTRIIHITATGNIYPCSWFAKLGLDERYVMKWEKGNLKDCMIKISKLEEVVKKRKELLGYSGCPALSYLYHKNLYMEDPLNEIFDNTDEKWR